MRLLSSSSSSSSDLCQDGPGRGRPSAPSKSASLSEVLSEAEDLLLCSPLPRWPSSFVERSLDRSDGGSTASVRRFTSARTSAPRAASRGRLSASSALLIGMGLLLSSRSHGSGSFPKMISRLTMNSMLGSSFGGRRPLGNGRRIPARSYAAVTKGRRTSRAEELTIRTVVPSVPLSVHCAQKTSAKPLYDTSGHLTPPAN